MVSSLRLQGRRLQDFKHGFLLSLSGLRPVTPVPVGDCPGWGAAKRRTDAAVVPLAIDRPPSSRRVMLQGGWASAVSAGQEFWLSFCTHIHSSLGLTLCPVPYPLGLRS